MRRGVDDWIRRQGTMNAVKISREMNNSMLTLCLLLLRKCKTHFWIHRRGGFNTVYLHIGFLFVFYFFPLLKILFMELNAYGMSFKCKFYVSLSLFSPLCIIKSTSNRTTSQIRYSKWLSECKACQWWLYTCRELKLNAQSLKNRKPPLRFGSLCFSSESILQ